jgi:hypothetical protein
LVADPAGTLAGMQRPTVLVLGALVLSCAAPRDEEVPGATGGASATSGDPTTSPPPPATATSTGGVDENDETSSSGSSSDPFDPVPDFPSGCGTPSELLSYIWIANAGQGTLSKIDTRTLTEEGRYIVRPDAAGNPSRTSVNLAGDVAVANRWGGLTKVYARPEICEDKNGDGTIQTSTGPDDVLAWGDEECIAWYRELNYAAQRPVAWTAGTYDEETCTWRDQYVWTSGANGKPGTLEIVRVVGDTGAIDTVVPIPDVHPTGWGAYGGAVDGDGNFYVSFYGGSLDIVRVDASTLDYEVLVSPLAVSYGNTMDPQGRFWVCGAGVARYDPATGEWASAVHDTQPLHSGPLYAGCMVDDTGHIWTSILGIPPNPLRGIDTETLEIDVEIDMPQHLHGISIDFDGFVWGVTTYEAYKVDPATGAWDSYDGLTDAYTYSDMTGVALRHVAAG